MHAMPSSPIAHAFVFAALLLCSTQLLADQSTARIAITEVLKNPSGKETELGGGLSHEFIEFINLGPDTFSIDSLFLTDGLTVDSVLPWSGSLPACPACLRQCRRIPPGRFALILDPDYAIAGENKPLAIGESTIVLTVNHASLAGGLTEDKGLVLFKGGLQDLHDSLAGVLAAGQAARLGVRLTHQSAEAVPEGFSLVPSAILLPADAWIASPDTLSAGRYEYLVPRQALLEYRVAPFSSGDSLLRLTLALYSPGSTTGEAASWRVSDKRSGAPITGGNIQLKPGAILFDLQLPADTIAYQLSLTSPSITVQRELDVSAAVSPQSPLRITEIHPRATTTIPEWIELQNTSSLTINLKGWQFGTSESRDTVTLQDCRILPQGFCVLTADRQKLLQSFMLSCPAVQPLHWQYLDNYRDSLHLWNSLSPRPAESVCYSSDWFTTWENQSLQRPPGGSRDGMQAGAWILCAKPSPGLPNTAVSWHDAPAPQMHLGPVPFTPNGDGQNDQLLIALQLPATAVATVTIYGFDGDRLLDLGSVTAAQLFWDGRDKDGRPAPPGPFFVVAQINFAGQKSTLRHAGVLWR
jgi:hypothetical protein